MGADERRPERVQLRRTKGWRKPPNTVVVARPSRWGNPFAVGARIIVGYAEVERVVDAEYAVRLFRRWLFAPHPTVDAAIIRNQIGELTGKNLACWCPLDEPCHADVLLDLANDGSL